MIVSRDSVPQGSWGDGCDAWELLATPGLSVKHERMPSGTREVRHHHARAEQFFFVLSGVLSLEVEGETYLVEARHGIAVAPGRRHQAINSGDSAVDFLVISTPPTAADRIEV
ncbi:MAG: cupin domain-containing protein [Pseudomonadota bacterium]